MNWSTRRGSCRCRWEEALAELVALGLANSDSFAGLRALLLPADRRRASSARGRRRVSLFGMADSGRWSWVRRLPGETGEAVVEHVARTLLKRWGRRVLAAVAGRSALAAPLA